MIVERKETQLQSAAARAVDTASSSTPEELPPTSDDIETMLRQLDRGAHTELARDLANAIAAAWQRGEVAPANDAVQALLDWLATAEEVADPEGIAEIRAARESLERGDGVPWEQVRTELGL